MQNIALAFVKSKQHSDAITAYEQILQEEPNIRTALNLILCYFKVGDRRNMKYTFQRLLEVDLHLDNEDRYLPQPVHLTDVCISSINPSIFKYDYTWVLGK